MNKAFLANCAGSEKRFCGTRDRAAVSALANAHFTPSRRDKGLEATRKNVSPCARCRHPSLAGLPVQAAGVGSRRRQASSRLGVKFKSLELLILLCRCFEMLQGFYGMAGRGFCISLFTRINGRVEMHNALLCMWIVLFGLGRIRVLEGGLGMSHEYVGMSLLAMVDGLFRMGYGLGQVILCSEDNTWGH
jgi:hypothetical protein